MTDLYVTIIIIVLTVIIVIGIFYFTNKAAMKAGDAIRNYCAEHHYGITEEDFSGGKKMTVSSPEFTLRTERVRLYHDAADASVNWSYDTRADIAFASDLKYIIGSVDSMNGSGSGGLDYHQLPAALRSMIEKKILDELDLPEDVGMPCFSYNVGKNGFLIFAESAGLSETILTHYKDVLENWPSDRRMVLFSDGKTIRVESNNLYIENVEMLDKVIRIALRAKELQAP